MRTLGLTVLAFAVGAMAGYFLAMSVYIIQTELLGAHDQDGGGAMAYGLVIGPFAGLVVGTLAGAVTLMRLTSKPRRGEAR